MKLSPAAVASIRAELVAAGHGERGGVVRRLAAAYGISTATVYRAAGCGGTGRPRAIGRPEYRDWTRIAVRLAHRAPGNPIPLDLAIEGGIEMGVLPAEAGAMPLPTARRIMRELGLVLRARRHQRLAADYPMQAVLVDASTSEHLVAERLEGEEWRLRLHRRPWSASGYKNKPLAAHRMRVVVYSLWEMCTGYTVSRYGVERGESAVGAMEFLCWALGTAKDPRLVVHGVPDDLWSDQGPLVRSDAARDLIERLDIALVTGAPYAKERMGGVERSHRTRWARFERALFLRESETITLSGLNARLVEFDVRENDLRPSRTPVGGRQVSRAAAWAALVRAREVPLRALPANPMETMAREKRAKIDGAGVIRWDGVEYEAGGGWHDRWVVARRKMDGSGDLAIVDEATEAKEIARAYARRPYGEVRGAPKTPLDRLLDEPAPAGGADLWRPPETEGLARFPGPGTAPAAPLENPLDADALESVEEAMRVFVSIYPHSLAPANRALVVERIERAGLSRRAVVEIASALTTLERRSA